MHVGEYELVRRLGHGGMAEVWLARWNRLGAERLVVVKRILPHLSGDPEFVRMFLDEIRLCTALDHPNIVQILDAGESEGVPYLVMEYIDGIPLDQLLAHGRPGPAESLGIAVETARALHFAHSRPQMVIHRDISPQNILISADGFVKLADFGIAKAMDMAPRTQAGVIKGKLAYLAPEQLRSGTSGPESDQYALGLLLFELLCGDRARPAADDLTLLNLAAEGFWNRHSAAWESVDPPVRAVVERMLTPEPQARYPDLRAVQRELQALLHRDWGDGWEDALGQRCRRIRERLPADPGRALSTSETNLLQPSGTPRRDAPPAGRAARHGRRRVASLVGLNLLLSLWLLTGLAMQPLAPPSSTDTTAIQAALPEKAVPPPRASPPPIAPRKSPPPRAPEKKATHTKGGWLTVQVLPWAEVHLPDGTAIQTPLVRHPLTAGPHRLRLHNPGLAWDLVTQVTIRPADETRLLFDLTEAAQ